MFYDKIATLCAKKGMTVNGLTNALDYSNATATKWKAGSKPRYKTLCEIAQFFNVDVEFLVDDDYMDYTTWLREVKMTSLAEEIDSTTKWIEEKTATKDDSLDEDFIAMAKQLSPAQMQRVKDFMRGVLS